MLLFTHILHFELNFAEPQYLLMVDLSPEQFGLMASPSLRGSLQSQHLVPALHGTTLRMMNCSMLSSGIPRSEATSFFQQIRMFDEQHLEQSVGLKGILQLAHCHHPLL